MLRVLPARKFKGRQETKLECLPRLLQLGLSLEDIAQSLDLSLDIVRQEARKYQQQ